MSPGKIRDPFTFLGSLTAPRPFVWYQFVEQRRHMYNLAALGLLLVCVAFPLLYSLNQLHYNISYDRIRPYWIALMFGSMVVVAFVIYSYRLHKLWDDSKWLSRYGRIEEANLLWVVSSPQRLVVSYRFWSNNGQEITKETVIDADGPYPLANLAAGDLVPILYDTRRPKRCMLWAEVERYVTLRESKAAATSHPMAATIHPN